jgi:hypothetical protein
MVHNNLHILFFHKFLFIYGIFTSFDLNNNTQLFIANYELKNFNFYPFYIWKKEVEEVDE